MRTLCLALCAGAIGGCNSGGSVRAGDGIKVSNDTVSIDRGIVVTSTSGVAADSSMLGGVAASSYLTQTAGDGRYLTQTGGDARYLAAGSTVGVQGVSGGTPVAVSGSVALSGTPAVSISGTPAVTVSGTPAVSISGTPTVALSGTPAVTVSGTVSVTGTTNVNVVPGLPIPVQQAAPTGATTCGLFEFSGQNVQHVVPCTGTAPASGALHLTDIFFNFNTSLPSGGGTIYLTHAAAGTCSSTVCNSTGPIVFMCSIFPGNEQCSMSYRTPLAIPAGDDLCVCNDGPGYAATAQITGYWTTN